MNHRSLFAVSIATLVLGVATTVIACGSSSGNNGFDEPTGSSGTSGTSSSTGSSSFGGDEDSGKGPAGCKGLQCQIVSCTNGKKTTLSGTVYAPTPQTFGAADPIYNAILYVPNGELAPFPKGVSCDKCGTITSGEPIVTALSGADGKFTLEDVPAGKDIPIVIQVGRWRRKVVVPNVEACAETKLTAEQTRLPRNKKEGDIPLFAVATSQYDPTECILRKIGIDDAEFTAPSGDGRVHLYHGSGNNISGAPAASSLWASADNLKKYDIVAFPCQTDAASKPGAGGTPNVAQYADQGGRAFITDLSEDIIAQGPANWRTTASFGGGAFYQNPAMVDTGFPKGKAMLDWLQAIGAVQGNSFNLQNTFARFSAVTAPAQRWIYSANSPQTYSFNTPVGAKEEDQCGRVVYSSFHIATPGSISTFPTACQTAPLTTQEKLLEFLLFDLAACVQKDDAPPTPPPPVK